MDNQDEEFLEISLDDILKEFGSPDPEESEPDLALPAEEPAELPAQEEPELSAPEEPPAPEPAAEEAPVDAEPVPEAEPIAQEPAELQEEEPDEPVEEPADEPVAESVEESMEEPVEESMEESVEEAEDDLEDELSITKLLELIGDVGPTHEEPPTPDPTVRLDDISELDAQTPADAASGSEEPEFPEDLEELSEVLSEELSGEEPQRPPIPFPGNERLRELKRKLIAGPEKRFYELSEIGVTRLQIAIPMNLLVFVLSTAATVMYSMKIIPATRLRFVIFIQVLSMLVSALLGSQEMVDGLADLFKFRFSIRTLLSVTFAACCADALFCFQELRVPCCSAFILEMTFALLARYHSRSTEMSQMDTLRKASRLRGIVREADVYNGRPGILRGEADVDDFLDTYQESPGPQKLQSVYCFIAMVLCLGIAALAGMLHGPSLGVQILSTALLVAVPASFFITVTRPAALLERRLHLVGTVICGWKGVKALSGKSVFPILDSDLFPTGSFKLNGVKYYGQRSPEQILSYTTSLITESGSGLTGVFQNLLHNRGATEYPVTEYVNYNNGGIGGIVQGEAVLIGSLNFMQDMGVEIPEGTMVSQAVYASINGELCAVVAVAYAKMRSATAGLISLCGCRRLIPVLAAQDFILTEEFIHEKFAVKTRRIQFPDLPVRANLAARKPEPEAKALAMVTRDDLVSAIYAISGSAALRTSCTLGMLIHLLGGIVGMLIMLALGYLGSVELLTPTNVLLYQLIWMVPGVLVTEWTRTV